jgi:predicted DCC family thiol-disulfide oxidoreductase YuxK
MSQPSDAPSLYGSYSYRRDPAIPAFPDDHPIIVFDGKCVMCSGFAQFIMRHDHQRRFRLMAAQSQIGTALYRHFGLDPVAYQTIILLEDGCARFKSDGAIRIFEQLGLPWRLVTVLRIIPSLVRDRCYELVARNRYRWFGMRPTCFLPDPTQADRFLG